jgi:FkbM family methyltransferase
MTAFFRRVRAFPFTTLPKLTRPATYARLLNTYNRLRRRPLRVKFRASDKTFEASDGESRLFACRAARLTRYAYGIKTHLEHMARQYFAHTLNFRPGDVVIDCGANVGELGVWLSGSGVRYVAVEPESREAACIAKNLAGTEPIVFQGALWRADGHINLHSHPDTGDSSTLEARPGGTVCEVPAITLTSLLDRLDIAGARLLKLEAEGAEPEVLDGAQAVLHLIEYVAVDCGYERGPQQEHTFVQVDGILKRHGFSVLQADFHRVVFLYGRASP